MEGGSEGPPSLNTGRIQNDRAAFWIGASELARDPLADVRMVSDAAVDAGSPTAARAALQFPHICRFADHVGPRAADDYRDEAGPALRTHHRPGDRRFPLRCARVLEWHQRSRSALRWRTCDTDRQRSAETAQTGRRRNRVGDSHHQRCSEQRDYRDSSTWTILRARV